MTEFRDQFEFVNEDKDDDKYILLQKLNPPEKPYKDSCQLYRKVESPHRCKINHQTDTLTGDNPKQYKLSKIHEQNAKNRVQYQIGLKNKIKKKQEEENRKLKLKTKRVKQHYSAHIIRDDCKMKEIREMTQQIADPNLSMKNIKFKTIKQIDKNNYEESPTKSYENQIKQHKIKLFGQQELYKLEVEGKINQRIEERNKQKINEYLQDLKQKIKAQVEDPKQDDFYKLLLQNDPKLNFSDGKQIQQKQEFQNKIINKFKNSDNNLEYTFQDIFQEKEKEKLTHIQLKDLENYSLTMQTIQNEQINTPLNFQSYIQKSKDYESLKKQQSENNNNNINLDIINNKTSKSERQHIKQQKILKSQKPEATISEFNQMMKKFDIKHKFFEDQTEKVLIKLPKQVKKPTTQNQRKQSILSQKQAQNNTNNGDLTLSIFQDEKYKDSILEPTDKRVNLTAEQLKKQQIRQSQRSFTLNNSQPKKQYKLISKTLYIQKKRDSLVSQKNNQRPSSQNNPRQGVIKQIDLFKKEQNMLLSKKYKHSKTIMEYNNDGEENQFFKKSSLSQSQNLNQSKINQISDQNKEKSQELKNHDTQINVQNLLNSLKKNTNQLNSSTNSNNNNKNNNLISFSIKQSEGCDSTRKINASNKNNSLLYSNNNNKRNLRSQTNNSSKQYLNMGYNQNHCSKKYLVKKNSNYYFQEKAKDIFKNIQEVSRTERMDTYEFKEILDKETVYTKQIYDQLNYQYVNYYNNQVKLV